MWQREPKSYALNVGGNSRRGVGMSNSNSITNRFVRYVGAALVLFGVAIWTHAAQAQSLTAVSGRIDPGVSANSENVAQLPDNLSRQVVGYSTTEAPGTIVVDTSNTYLYFVLGGGKAIRYGIGVGREGFAWSGAKVIERKSEWPDWIPPSEMLRRQPYLPRFMAGGEGNPLGARAMYLSGSVYRIHGTNAPSTIGKRVSSGCIRMLNEDVIDLYGRTHVGTRVVVLPMDGSPVAQAHAVPRIAGERTHVAVITTNLH
jgi:lipoprotein-anchoring transpeptidase ErfK/SrfK